MICKRFGYLLLPVFLFVFSSLHIWIGSMHVYAQDSAGITLVPASIEEPADLGAVFTRELKITNQSDADTLYYLSKRNIKGVEAGGVPIFAEDDAEITGFELSEWLAFESETVFIPARQTVIVPFVISVPEDATPGSHFGGVFVSVEPPRLRQTGAGVGYVVSSVISIRVTGDVIDTARIRSLSTDKIIYSEKNVSFIAKIENQGSILIRPRGPMTIESTFSGKRETFIVNDNLAGVFPGAVRDIAFTWESEGLGFGRYEAVLALVYDGQGGQRTIDATHSFWVFPIKIMMIILGSFLGIFAAGYLLTRYYIRQAIMRASGTRRIVTQRYRRQAGLSRFAFVFVSMLTVLVIFLIILLMLFA